MRRAAGTTSATRAPRRLAGRSTGQWAVGQGLVPRQSAIAEASRPRPAATPRHAPERKIRPLEIANPPSGATYLIDPTLRREFQTLPLRATTERPGILEWFVDGRSLGRTASDALLMWPLSSGTHTVMVRDEQGRSATAAITVK